MSLSLEIVQASAAEFTCSEEEVQKQFFRVEKAL